MYVPRRDTFVHIARRRHRDLRVGHTLEFLGKHARTARELAVNIKRHVDATWGLVDSVKLVFVALFVHKNDAAHQRRVLKATRLKLDIHSCPFIRCERWGKF